MFSVTVTVTSVGFRSIKRSKRIVTAASVFRFGLAAAAEGPGCGAVSGESPCGRRGADPGEGASGPFTGDSAAGHFRPPPRSPQLHGTSPLLQPGNRRSSRAPSAPAGQTPSSVCAVASRPRSGELSASESRPGCCFSARRETGKRGAQLLPRPHGTYGGRPSRQHRVAPALTLTTPGVQTHAAATSESPSPWLTPVVSH